MMTAERAWLREAPPGFGMAAEEETRMLEDAKAGSRAQRRRRRHGRRHGRRSSGEDAEDTTDELASIDESLLSDEDRAYRVARKLADRKVELSRQVFRGTLITVPLLIFVPALGAISLVYFGVVLGRRAFKLLYEPRLRERFLQEEVQRRVHTRVSDERRQLEGEHHRSLEQLSASIAHEIRNPITAAKSLVQQMGEDPNGADQVEYARVAVAELERVEKSISHLLRYAREEEMQIGEVVMEDVLESALETFRDRAERSAVAIHRQYDSSGRMRGDGEQLRRVVINLVGNAIDALEEARIQAPEIRVAMGENLAGTEVWVRIADNGMGMEDEVSGRIFDPFYTSRAAGTGLGLALCRKIVDNHGGGIEVETGPGEGTEFILTFPKRPQPGGASS
jgi:two-component system sensor histidine kinase HydH